MSWRVCGVSVSVEVHVWRDVCDGGFCAVRCAEVVLDRGAAGLLHGV